MDIESLKERLVHDTNLSQFWDYYFTNFAERPDFNTRGAACQNEAIEMWLHMLAAKLFGPGAALRDLFLIEIPEFRLIHGGCFIQDRLVTLLFFPEMKAGVVAIAIGPGDRVTYARMTTR